MANVYYQDLFWQVRSELPGVPLPLLYMNYAEAVRQFCVDSKAWQYSCPNALDLDADEAFPDITVGTDIPASTYIVEPVRIKWSSGKYITFKTRDQLDSIAGDWEQRTASIPDHWTITEPGQFRLYPLLSTAETEAVYLRVAIAPIVAINGSRNNMPEALANEWAQAWAYGALSRLMKIPGKDWTNISLASSYGDLFEDCIVKAKSRAAADYGRPNRQVVYGGLPIGGSDAIGPDDYRR